MRLDRSLTTAVFHPLKKLGLPSRASQLPILMYHSLSDNPEPGVGPYFRTNTDPVVFQQQMGFLAAEGYKTLSLTQAVRALGGNPFPEKSVVITFDDGFRDFYIHGFPVLREYGFTATMFLPTAFIEQDRRSFKSIECLTWPEIREMRNAGIEFGSHTVHHPKLRDLPRHEILTELAVSKDTIEQNLSEAIGLFAYPYAFPQENAVFASDFRELLVQTGYTSCVTTELGRVRPGDDPYRLKRLPANTLDDSSLLKAKLEGGYDWLAVPQGIIKKLKRAAGRRKNDLPATPLNLRHE